MVILHGPSPLKRYDMNCVCVIDFKALVTKIKKQRKKNQKLNENQVKLYEGMSCQLGRAF